MISVGIRFAHTASAWEKTRGHIKSWLQRAAPPVGVFASLDILGRHVAQIAHDNGQLVPRDVAIVSAHNEPTLCLCPEPTLTSIEYGFDQIGYEAARLIGRLLRGESPDPPIILAPPRELVIRRSSDFTYVDDAVVAAAVQFIAQNSQRRISVDDVAFVANVSRRNLEQRFQKYLGHAVAAEIRRVRIDQAKRLLANSELSIGQIARVAGFGAAQQMARVFRRETGASPSEFRETHRTVFDRRPAAQRRDGSG